MTGIWIVGGVAAIAVAIIATVAWRTHAQKARFERARKIFHTRREYLEAKFFELAAATGKPRGLEWVNCDFDNDVAYARDRESGRITALVAVAIQFEAIEGGGMEEVEAVANLKAATAVFHYNGDAWSTEGRTIFNLNPTETIAHYRLSLEALSQDLAGSA